MLDLIIRNAKIVDGTGNPWFTGDIGIKNGCISGVGRVDLSAREEMDAGGLVAAPGFIDGHSHSDLMVMDRPDSVIKLQQGVTTEVVGNCGLAPAPFFPTTASQLKQYVEPVLGGTRQEWSWNSIQQYMDALEQVKPSENVATYVAHGALRIAVMGFENRPATQAENELMKTLLVEGLQAGAIGLSIGLLYAPGSFTSKEELAKLCEVLPGYNGLLSAHIRGEGNSLLESIREVIWVAEKAEVPLHISHLKAAGKRNWGIIDQALELIEDARARGLDVTCDVYPYRASSTMLTTLLPPWVLAGGAGQMLDCLKDPVLRRRILAELAEEQAGWDNLLASTGWQSVVVSAVHSQDNKEYEGLSMEEIGSIRGQHPGDSMIDLLLEEQGKISMIYYNMSDEDVDKVVRYDRSLIISDSLGCQTGKPHPRLYGAFPRLFSRYVREKRLLTLEQAVRKVTSYPARRFKLGKRGLLLEGFKADIVLFDPLKIQDQATFQDPCQFPAGISHVLVGGSKTIEQGVHTCARNGSVIRDRERGR